MFGNYSPDEAVALVTGSLIGFAAWTSWYYSLLSVGRAVRRRGNRAPLLWAPLICALLLYAVLARWSADDVRTDSAYLRFYLVIGAAWLGVFRGPLPLLGLSVRDDVLERGNDAAAWAISGALVGGMCCFAGGNVGNGPGWWVVLFSAGLSTAALLFLWWVLHAASTVADKVTIDRDVAAGLRSAGFLVGTGMILGRAVAGDWVSAGATTVDFARMAWPAAILTAACITIERSFRPEPNPAPGAVVVSGWLPACLYILAGIAGMFMV